MAARPSGTGDLRRWRAAAWVAVVVAGWPACGDADLVQTGVAADLATVSTDASVDWGSSPAAAQADATATSAPAGPPVCPAGPPCVCPLGVDGPACSDGNACTYGETCTGGACFGGKPVPCTAAGPCQTAFCDPKAGCAWSALPDGTPCSDSNPCTQADQCSGGQCGGKPADCNDGNPCTADGCGLSDGCTHTALAAPCSDGNACTQFDACSEGQCAGKMAANGALCDDANPCTADTCDAATGCQHAPSKGACDDGNPCTDGDACANSACQPGPSNPCACQADSDCAGMQDSNPCSGKLFCDLNGGHLCKIKPGSAVVCPSTAGKPCQQSWCDGKTGKCVVKQLTGPCDDGDACTAWSECQDGDCLGEGDVPCDDGNPCTADGCATKSGCFHKPASDGAPCGSEKGFVCKSLACVKPCKLFEAVVGGPSFDYLTAVAPLAGGGWLAVGSTVGEGKGKQGWALRWGDDNVLQYQLAMGATASDELSAVSATTSFVCAAGSTGKGDGDTAGWVVRLDVKNASELWEVTLGEGENARFFGAVSTGKACVVVGQHNPKGGTQMTDGWMVALDPAGAVLWQKDVGFQSNDGLFAVESFGAGGLLAAGWSITAGQNGDSDALLVRVTPDGELTWVKQVGSPYYESAHSLLVTGDYFYAAGTASGPNLSGFDGFLVASTNGGQIQWQKTIGWNKDDRFYDLAVLPAGGALVAVGETDSFGKGDSDGWVVRMDTGGKVAWTKTFGSSKNDNLSAATPLTDGGVVAVGSYGGAGPKGEAGPNGWVLRLDSTAALSCD